MPKDVLALCAATAESDDRAAAEALAVEALAKDGDDGPLWRLLGLLRHARGDSDGAADALPALARAQELAPDLPLYRISLAAVLDGVGRRDEAYDLLCPLDLDKVGCRCCLERMSAIFHAAGDARRAEVCRSRVAGDD